MRVAFCVEDDTDEVVAVALLSKMTQNKIEPDTTPYRIQRGGWSNALKVAPSVAWSAYHRGLAGAVFMIDNDGAEPEHVDAHELAPNRDCRLCALRNAAAVAKVKQQARPSLAPLWLLFAVPVQTLETWLLLARGTNPSLVRNLGTTGSERRQLKRLLYGTDDPTRVDMIDTALPIVSAMDVRALADQSPSFGYFLNFALALQANGPALTQ